MRALRKLVLGETWVIPGGIALLLAGGAVLWHLSPSFWRGAGPLLLAAGVVLILGLAVLRSLPPPRRGDR